MKKYDITITIILIVEAENEDYALDKAVIDIEDNFDHSYIADKEIVEIEEKEQ